MNFSSILFLLYLSVSAGAGATVEPFACNPTDPDTNGFPFCRNSIPIPERVKDLIGRLTLPEKVKLLVNNAAAVPRLGIRGYEWWSEALHGVSNVGPGTKFGGEYPGATSFPQVITTAASFNATLWEEIGRVVSDEARAMYNGGMAGLTFWSPNINIFRDPRWGRGQETPGEDPIVAGRYASSYVRGLQGYDENRLKVAACCKHYTAYDLDNWSGVDRFHFNAKVSKQDMADTFDVPFPECVTQGNVACVMCSYNQVNGVPTCADPKLLRGTIRRNWHLNGYIVSDCDSVGVFYANQHYTSTPEEAAADAIKAGLDLDCGPFLAIHTEQAINRGILKDTDINNALFNTITVQMRLGMFDFETNYTRLTAKDVCTPANQDLALQAARQGIVLMKNRGEPGLTLPLSLRRHRRVAVIGPNADATLTMIGNYAGLACGYTSPLQGIGRYARVVYHEQGCSGGVSCVDETLFDGAVETAGRADATVLVMGLDQSVEAEFRDRVGLLLPGKQMELVSKVAAVSKGPVVLVLMSGGPIDVSFARDDSRVHAIVWAGYPGQAGGTAIADVLFGSHNPEGKLPMTWYHQDYLLNLPMTTMGMRPDPKKGYPGRTYRFYRGPVVYPFGHGLGYSDFLHTIVEAPTVVFVPLHGRHWRNNNNSSTSSNSNKAIRVTHAKCNKLSVVIRVNIRNVGHRNGVHTLLVFSKPPSRKGHWAPHKQLVAFEKIHVPAGEERHVSVNIHVCKYLSVVDRTGIRRIPLGKHKLRVGSSIHSVSLQEDTIGIVKS